MQSCNSRKSFFYNFYNAPELLTEFHQGKYGQKISYELSTKFLEIFFTLVV